MGAGGIPSGTNPQLNWQQQSRCLCVSLAGEYHARTYRVDNRLIRGNSLGQLGDEFHTGISKLAY